jgi:PAS domain S-box-containing protein|tara:strand:+ start:6395 stop:9442 length:3048 start_codon:yes stop_codon:yes gene_type:complete
MSGEVDSRTELQEELTELKSVLHAVRAAVVVHDPEGKVILSNAFADELFGRNQESIQGVEFDDPAWKFIHENGTEIQADEYPVNRAIATREPTASFVLGMLPPNSAEPIWLETDTIPLCDSNEVLKQVVVTSVDITERKRAEQELRESEERFRSFIDSATEGCSFYDSELNFLAINQAGMAYFPEEIRLDDVVGTNLLEIIPSLAGTGRYAEYLKVVETGNPFSASDVVPDPKFGDRYLDTRAFKVGDGLGMIVTDVTERTSNEEALRASEEQFQDLFNSMREGFALCQIILDEEEKPIDYRFLKINPAFEDQSGMSVIDSLGKTIKEIYPDIEPYWIERYGHVAVTGEPMHAQDYNHNTNKWYDAIAFSPSEGKFAMLFRDITERKRAEDELRESRGKYRKLVEGNPYGIQEIDTAGTITYSNPAYQRMLGYSEDELSGESILSLLEPASRQNELREYLDKLVSDQPQPTIYLQQNRKKDGRIIDQEVAWEYNRDNEGRVVGFTSVITDVTERKKAEDALRQSEERFKAIYEHAPVLIDAFDESGKCVLWNEQCRKTFGWTIEEINANDDALTVFYPDPTVRDEVMQTVTTDPDGRFREWHPVTKDGKVLSTMWANFRLPDGLAFNLGYDITDRKRMEEEMLKTEKLESVGVLAGGIAHDLNNYLTSIVGNIGLAQMYDDPADKDRRLAIAEQDALRVKELTQRLLTFAKGGMPVRKLSDLVDVVREALEFSLSGSDLGCDCVFPDDPCPAEFDEGQVKQVINNLVINAQQAMPEGGTMRVSIERFELDTGSRIPLALGPYVKISVEDSGVGIPAEDRNRIFDPFFSTKPTGSGLGLATAYSIIQKHGGYISVESKVGVGTEFEVYLPASPQELSEREERVESDLQAGEGRILVMDDQEHIRDLIELSLSKLGYEVVTCADGAEAIEMYQEGRDSDSSFQAVILDLTIPGGMGGRVTLEHLREMDPGVTAIVASGYAADQVVTDYRDYGFKGAITKPYRLEGLKAVLHEVLNKS